jgi:RNA polymerase sigma-70 factor (ECF subfamily)
MPIGRARIVHERGAVPGSSERSPPMMDGFPGAPSQAAVDHDTIRRTLAGDRAAAAVLADRLAVIHRILTAVNARAVPRLRPQDLEDLAQDVLVVVWGKLRLFRGEGTLERWLYRFCLNEFHNRRRREGQRQHRVKLLEDKPVPDDVPQDPDLDSDKLQEALCELGPPSEPVIRLKHEGGHSFEEVARILGIPPSTAKTRYYEGIRWLRWRLERSLEA